MIWRWSLNPSVVSVNRYDSLYSLYTFVLFETIQFIDFPFLLLAFFLISFSFFFWYPLHHPAVLWILKVGGADSRLFLSKSNPEHTCLSILIILPINLFSLVCFSLLVRCIKFFLLLVWYWIRHQAKADSRNNCVAWSAWTRNKNFALKCVSM